jgi:triphosphoribosyl-dephospho-CoA synthase
VPSPSDRFGAAVAAEARLIPPALAAGSRGWSAAVASILEAAAAKPGNVHPAASFPDLAFADLAAAGIAIAPVLEAAATRPLGATIRDAVAASRAASRSNANLGIVLVVAPLAAVPDDAGPPTPVAVERVLGRLDSGDAAAIWEAIRTAQPGGLGTSGRWDLADPPPADIRAAMRHAADRDTVARLWGRGYDELFAGPVADLAADIAAGLPLETAIIRSHLRQLARRPDSLIARRHGAAAAAEVSARAADMVALEGQAAWPRAVAEFDASLRRPRRLNPGTTADLVAGGLYILLTQGLLHGQLPFTTPPPSLPPSTSTLPHP